MVNRWTFSDYWQGQAKTIAFTYTGGVQSFTVPDGIYQVHLQLRGGNGGGQLVDNIPSGGIVSGWLPVTPGDVLYLRVGGDGAFAATPTGGLGGWNGGGPGGQATTNHKGGCGGGGATDVRLNGNDWSDLVALAGGGGGNSGQKLIGGPGGGVDGDNYRNPLGAGGKGGTQTAGGAAGPAPAGTGRTNGSSGQGGTGAADSAFHGCGGGGGGLYGGGGGGIQITPKNVHYDYGGGGGSNYTDGLDDSQPVFSQTGAFIGTQANLAPLATVEITFTGTSDVYQFDINPNDGGSPEATKQMTTLQNVGPNRINLVQEGRTTTPTLAFSGVILTQQHYEALELWFDRRVLIEMVDDLGRTFYGVFSKYSPKRVRRPNNPWYHTYDAEFTVAAYVNASGQNVYGRII